jgi:hypothetical protein
MDNRHGAEKWKYKYHLYEGLWSSGRKCVGRSSRISRESQYYTTAGHSELEPREIWEFHYGIVVERTHFPWNNEQLDAEYLESSPTLKNKNLFMTDLQ